MMEIGRDQMKLLEGNLPQKANEVVVSEYFLSTYGNNAKIGDSVTLDTESFHGDYVHAFHADGSSPSPGPNIQHASSREPNSTPAHTEIGRASCRERV